MKNSTLYSLCACRSAHRLLGRQVATASGILVKQRTTLYQITSFHQDFSHYRVPAGKILTIHTRVTLNYVKDQRFSFKTQNRTPLPPTEPLMMQVCSAPAHSLTRNTQMSYRRAASPRPGQSPAWQPQKTGGLPQFESSWQARDNVCTGMDVCEVFKCRSTQVVRHP